MAKNKKYIDKNGVSWGSEDEYKVWKWLKESGYHPEVQYPFIPGRRFRADFAFPNEKVIIEVMGLDIAGWAGHNNVFTMSKDYIRDMIATAYGWKMIYWCKGVSKTDLLYYLDYILRDEIPTGKE